jgi:hypothetical protein
VIQSKGSGPENPVPGVGRVGLPGGPKFFLTDLQIVFLQPLYGSVVLQEAITYHLAGYTAGDTF